MRLRLPVALALLLATPTVLPAQVLTLRDALARAGDRAYANRVADGTVAAQAGQATAALRGILPSVRVEGGYVGTNDPIGAFGTTLRQRAITQADFDPARLNDPAAVTNLLGGVVVEQPVLNIDAWLVRRAATRGAAAGRAAAEWTRLGTRVDVIRAYYGATLAHEKVATLAAAARAAQAHVRQAEAMVRQGMVTRSDVLLASVRAGEIDAQLAEAEAGARTSVRELAVVLGEGGAFVPALPDRLPSAARIRAVVAGDAPAASTTSRADVVAARIGLDAARLDLQRARSLLLPRLNAFARYDWNAESRLFGGHRSWTAGVMASWSVFAGGSELAERQTSAGREDAARAMADAARERALLDVERAASAFSAAMARLGIAERAVDQSAEAHRIVARRYEGGLATVIELLDAAAIETQSALGLSAARHAAIAAEAERHRAIGRDPSHLVALDDESSPIATTSR